MAGKRAEAPVDFSFCELTAITGVLEEEPRSGICKRTVISGGETPEVPPVYASRPKGAITTLKLNNNAIASLEGLGEALDGTLWEPSQLQFLDLSFNELETIREIGDSEAFADLGGVYLHGNKIALLRELKPLAKLARLRVLTLHGNEVEKKKGYRLEVISMLPNLKKLDHSVVTSSERKSAELHQRNKPKRVPKD